MTIPLPNFTVDHNGWMSGARRVFSPNYDERPQETAIDLVVIHGISLPPGTYDGQWIDALFTNTIPEAAHPYFSLLKGMRVSSHLLVRRNGELVQYVSFHHRAWHAGVSTWTGRPGCNDYSIGIELEGTDTEKYMEIQYTVLSAVIQALMKIYSGIVPERIVGHSDIAPERKTDPGSVFDWERLRRSLQ